MVLCKTRMPRSVTSVLLPLSVLALASGCASGPARAPKSNEPTPAAANGRLRELMIQRYQILQRGVQNEERLLEAGRVDIPASRQLHVALYRAEADLCTTDAERVRVYEKLMDFLSRQETWLEQQAANGRVPQAQVDEGKLATLNAQIDLERLRLGLPTSHP